MPGVAAPWVRAKVTCAQGISTISDFTSRRPYMVTPMVLLVFPISCLYSALLPPLVFPQLALSERFYVPDNLLGWGECSNPMHWRLGVLPGAGEPRAGTGRGEQWSQGGLCCGLTGWQSFGRGKAGRVEARQGKCSPRTRHLSLCLKDT